MITIDDIYISDSINKHLEKNGLPSIKKLVMEENLEIHLSPVASSEYFLKIILFKKYKKIYFYCMPVVEHPQNKPLFHLYDYLEEFSHQSGILSMIKKYIDDFLLSDSKIEYKNGWFSFSTHFYLLKNNKWKKYYSGYESKIMIKKLTYQEFLGKTFRGYAPSPIL